ncbi:MAG TPA: MFS transporter [Streptosporangiaceae bacterium]
MNTSGNQRWVLGLTSVAALMVSLDVQVVATALPVIRVHLHASLAALEWTVNAYTLSFAVLLLTGAALGERFGRRRMLVAGIGLFTAASAACALAPDAGALIAARAVQGGGGALMLPLAMSLLSAAFPPERRPWALGIFTSVTGIAVLAGPVLGGAVAQGMAWPWIFWLNVPIGVVLIPLVLVKMRDHGGQGAVPGMDVPGLVLGTAGVLGIVWALIRSDSLGWASPEIVSALSVGVVLGVAFTWWELRTAQPMMPVRLFASRPFAAGNAAIFAIVATMMSLVFFMAQYLQTGLGYDPLGAGLRLVPGWAAPVVIAPFSGPLIRRVGERPLVAGGMAVTAAGLAWIALIGRTGLPYGQLVAPLIITGTGVSLAMPAAASAVMRSVRPAMIGKASGTFNTLRQLGGVFGLAICAAVFAGHGGYGSPASFTAGFGPALGACAGLAAAAAISGLFLPGHGPQPTGQNQLRVSVPATQTAPVR